eukprot:8231961-Karenia_brevis.AAC.1
MRADPVYNHWGILLHPTDTNSDSRRPGKTGVWDDAVLVDCAQWIYPSLQLLKSQHKDNDDRIWSMPLGHLQTVFNSGIKSLGMESLRPSLYSLRHGGASEDLLRRRRSLQEVRRRGRWMSDSSLKRYAKETRLLAELSKIPEQVLLYGRQMDLIMDR